MGCFCVKSSGERIEELITNKTPITLNNTTDSSQIDMEMYVNNYINYIIYNLSRKRKNIPKIFKTETEGNLPFILEENNLFQGNTMKFENDTSKSLASIGNFRPSVGNNENGKVF